MSEEAESPTRYMLPEQVEEGMVDYSLNDHSPAKYPIDTKKKRKKKKDKKDKVKKRKEKGKAVHFQPKVELKTIYHTLKDRIQDIDLTREEEYPLRTTAFALKRKRQKEILKYQHQYRPLTPRRQRISTHIRVTLQRVNCSSSSTPQTQTLTQTLS